MPSSNFNNQVTPLGAFVFGTLVEPRENPNSGKLEWNMGFVVPLNESEKLMALIEDALADFRQRNPKFPATNDKLHLPFRPSMKKDETGERVEDPDNLLFSFKRNAHKRSKTGETSNNTPPSLYDSLGRNVTGTIDRVPTGSTGKVVFDVYVYDMPGAKGVSFQLVGFQIAQMKEQAVELPPIEGGWVPDDTEVDSIAAALAADV